MRDVTHATREAVAEREAAESRCRAALARLATAVRLDKPETRAPEDIVDALRESRARREDTAAKISRLQRREQDTWRRLAAEKAALRTARLGLASARGRDARRSERTSRGGFFVETALGSSDEDAVFAGSGTVGADADERITRESEMEDTLAAAEKTLGASFRRFRAAMERLATLDEGLRKIDDMIDRVTRPGSGFVGSVDDRGGRRGVRGGSSDAAARRRRSACAVGGRSSEARRKTPRVGDSDSRSNRGLGSLRRRSLPSSPVAESVAESVELDDELDDESDVDARELAALDERGSTARASVSERRLRPLLRFLSPPRRVEFRRRWCSSVRVPSRPARLDATLRRLLDVLRGTVVGRLARPSIALGVRSETAGAGFRGPPAGGSRARLGRVAAFAGEVDDDPARMKLKRGRAYREMAMKWCFRAGRPIADEGSDEELVAGDDGVLRFGDEDGERGAGAETAGGTAAAAELARAAEKGLGSAAIRKMVARAKKAETVPTRTISARPNAPRRNQPQRRRAPRDAPREPKRTRTSERGEGNV